MKIYPEFLEPAVREDLLASHSFYEPAQFAYLLEAFAEHYLRHRPLDLVEVSIDPAFARELLASNVDPHLAAPAIASRLGQRLGRKVHLYVVDRGGLGLGLEELGLAPGDFRAVPDERIDGDLVVHFLDGERVVYSRPFEDELVLSAGRTVRSRFLGRPLLKRYGELYVIFQELAEPAALQALNDLELRIAPDRSGKLCMEVEPSGRREPVRMGERVALCQLGPDHRLSLIVTPRGQDPAPPHVEGIWAGVAEDGTLEAQALVRESFEMRGARVSLQLSPRQAGHEPVTLPLELLGRHGAVQRFRGRLQPAEPLEPGLAVDARLSGVNRSGFRVEATGSGHVTLHLERLLLPVPLAPPPFLSPSALQRGLELGFLLEEQNAAGRRFLLHCRRGEDELELGPVPCAGGRLVFSVPPVEDAEPGTPLELWLSCDDPAVPLALGGNGPAEPLLTLPVYAIAPGARPITGPDNYVFADEVLLFGHERLRLVRWAPPYPVRYPAPEQHPYFLWRTREGRPARFFVRDGALAAEDGSPLREVRVGASGAAAPGEACVSTAASGRDVYLTIQVADGDALSVRKAAGRIHDVALNFEPLGPAARLPAGGSLLVAGTALFGVRSDRENLELTLLGHFLGTEELQRGVRVCSTRPAEAEPAWIHVPFGEPLAMTLQQE
jgi:hypothetical protein